MVDSELCLICQIFYCIIAIIHGSSLHSIATLKRRLRAMNLRRHDEVIGANEVIKAVSVSYLNKLMTDHCLHLY